MTSSPKSKTTAADPITLSLSAWRPKANGERDIMAHAEMTVPSHLLTKAMIKAYALGLVTPLDAQIHPRAYNFIRP